MEDLFVPKSAPEAALVQQMHTVTFHTSDREATERAFIEGYGLESSGWQRGEATVGAYLGLGAQPWETCCFFKSGEGANIQVRVIHTGEPGERVRPEYGGQYLGGATISFPRADLRAHEKIMNAIGYQSTMGVKEIEFQSPTGEVYTSAEIIYYAPENCYFLAVKRPEIFIPVGPTDPKTGVGGAAYSARCVEHTDAILDFLRNVLGYEIRRDVILRVGEKSALGLPQGAEERFIQAFAPGARTGYMVLMDHGDIKKASPAATQGLPSKGIVMYSMATRDMDAVHAATTEQGATVLQEPQAIASPFLGCSRAMTIADPDGFVFEIFQT